MNAVTAKLFKNGQSQAVRIPKPFQFRDTDEVVIRRQGSSVIITPKRKSWLSLAELGAAGSDFMESRPELFDPDRVVFR